MVGVRGMVKRQGTRVREVVVRQGPLATNCLVLGGMSGGAELCQQVLLRRFLAKEEEISSLDLKAVSRYTAVGAGISVALTAWYSWLDRRLPGASASTIVKKVAVDAFVLNVPYYTAFYLAMGCMEGRPTAQVWAEVKAKLPTTVLYSLLLWPPAQAINFRFVAPAHRVVYIAVVCFLEFNMLAVMKRRPVQEKEN